MKKALTAAGLTSLKPTGKPYYVSDAKQDGLRVRVSPTGGLTWVVSFRIKGQGVTSASLGIADASGKAGKNLGEARERAAAILKAARGSRDLLAEERAERRASEDALTVEQLIARYVKNLESPGRRGGPLRTADDIQRRLNRALASKLKWPVERLTRGDFSRLFDAVAERHPREAEKRRQSAHAMLRWASAKGYVQENPLTGTPSYGAGEPRDRVLSADELRALWTWLNAGARNLSSDIIAVLRIQMLLGARVGEVAGMLSGEIAEEGERLIWTLPAGRSKNKRARVTPLVGLARQLIEAALERRVGALFRTRDNRRALTSTDIGQALLNRKKSLPVAHFTTHDLRRTVVSKMDELGISLDTIAATIGHQRGTAATQVLVRHYSRPVLDPQVEAALTAWEKCLAQIAMGVAFPSNVRRISSASPQL